MSARVRGGVARQVTGSGRRVAGGEGGRGVPSLSLIFMETRLREAALWHGVASGVAESLVLWVCADAAPYADPSVTSP